MNRIQSNKSLFNFEDQTKAINKANLIDLEQSKNVEEWNKNRKSFIQRNSNGMNLLMILGYVDGVLHAKLFGRKKVSL